MGFCPNHLANGAGAERLCITCLVQQEFASQIAGVYWGEDPDEVRRTRLRQDDAMENVVMSWILLIVAGLLEACWVVGLKYTDGFSKLWPSLLGRRVQLLQAWSYWL